MPHVMIATPSPGMVKTGYVRTVVRTIADLDRHKIAWSYFVSDGGDLIDQRNIAAARFLENPAHTHFFMIDGDMEFAGDLCRRLLSFEKPMVGGVYQGRNARADRQRWVISFGDGPIKVTNGLTRCAAIGLGCLLVQRSVFETMISVAIRPREGPEHIRYNFFGERLEDVAANERCSDDFSFARRWTRDCGGEIWTLLDVKIGHIGDYAYGTDQSFLDDPRLKES
jgi:hypothetical protein